MGSSNWKCKKTENCFAIFGFDVVKADYFCLVLFVLDAAVQFVHIHFSIHAQLLCALCYTCSCFPFFLLKLNNFYIICKHYRWLCVIPYIKFNHTTIDYVSHNLQIECSLKRSLRKKFKKEAAYNLILLLKCKIDSSWIHLTQKKNN